MPSSHPIKLKAVLAGQAQVVAEVLRDACPPEEFRWAYINDSAATTYEAYLGPDLVAGATVRWGEESEIDLLAVHPDRRREGIGTVVIEAIKDEARRRQVRRLIVGTACISFDNICFYQRCGFRMSHIRRGYFDKFYDPPHVWNGIPMRDMIVFDYEL